MQGGSASIVRFSTGKPFYLGRISDFDVAISQPDLYKKAESLGIGKGGSGGPIDMTKELGIDDALQKHSRISGNRPVNVMIFSSPEIIKLEGKGIRIPGKHGG
ncbi:hypothetical protein [Serratia fonticola]|uniref:hypothetical protein n=1 Tax=Serratia fonticola TaxID=47917 RepID=UPI0014196D7F|nr:hypothetical protein [Serratia fonticola]